MDTKQREAWNARVPTVTVLDRCDKCEQLKQGVQERRSYWPVMLNETCCAECFTRLVGQSQGYVAC